MESLVGPLVKLAPSSLDRPKKSLTVKVAVEVAAVLPSPKHKDRPRRPAPPPQSRAEGRLSWPCRPCASPRARSAPVQA